MQSIPLHSQDTYYAQELRKHQATYLNPEQPISRATSSVEGRHLKQVTQIAPEWFKNELHQLFSLVNFRLILEELITVFINCREESKHPFQKVVFAITKAHYDAALLQITTTNEELLKSRAALEGEGDIILKGMKQIIILTEECKAPPMPFNACPFTHHPAFCEHHDHYFMIRSIDLAMARGSTAFLLSNFSQFMQTVKKCHEEAFAYHIIQESLKPHGLAAEGGVYSTTRPRGQKFYDVPPKLMKIAENIAQKTSPIGISHESLLLQQGIQQSHNPSSLLDLPSLPLPPAAEVVDELYKKYIVEFAKPTRIHLHVLRYFMSQLPYIPEIKEPILHLYQVVLIRLMMNETASYLFHNCLTSIHTVVCEQIETINTVAKHMFESLTDPLLHHTLHTWYVAQQEHMQTILVLMDQLYQPDDIMLTQGNHERDEIIHALEQSLTQLIPETTTYLLNATILKLHRYLASQIDLLSPSADNNILYFSLENTIK